MRFFWCSSHPSARNPALLSAFAAEWKDMRAALARLKTVRPLFTRPVKGAGSD